MLAALPFFQTANYLEAAFWLVIAAGCVIAITRTSGIPRRNCVIAAIAFAFFGVSDIIEASTGAWYHPWWLLVWKGLCLLVLFWLLAQYIAARRRQS